MRSLLIGLCLGAASLSPILATAKSAAGNDDPVQLGPRPFYLVEQLAEGPLKEELQNCVATKRSYKRTDFSIGHRGAPLQFPEHTRESYMAAARMGAGILECDVTFTSDRELVCRHAQCDLHTTTNILATPLAQKCSVAPEFDGDGKLTNGRSIQCCTSDITLAEFKTLEGKMDAADRNADSIAGYMNNTADFRTDLYSGGTRGTLMSHRESIALFNQLGVGMTPELKAPQVDMPFEGDYSQEDYAQQMIDEYVEAGVDPRRVWPQSFNYADVLYWVQHNPAYGEQAVYLDGRDGPHVTDPDAVAALVPSMEQVAADGVNIIAPPIYMMLDVDNGDIVPSAYAKAAQAAGLDMIGWSLERSGQLAPGGGGYYYSTVSSALQNDGDILTVVDALAQEVGIIGLFSDWPATTTFYANCKRPARS